MIYDRHGNPIEPKHRFGQLIVPADARMTFHVKHEETSSSGGVVIAEHRRPATAAAAPPRRP